MIDRRTLIRGIPAGMVAAYYPVLSAQALGPQPSRIALVIGNSDYKLAKLNNATHDAGALALLLARPEHGFKLFGGGALPDLSEENLRATLLRFAAAARNFDIALVYYAGHGFSAGDLSARGDGRAETYIVPTDVNLDSASSLIQRTISLSDLLAATSGARQARIIILDACRDFSFRHKLLIASSTGEVTRGLAPPLSVPPGSLIAYAAKEGQLSLDGAEYHSPYARALLDEIPVPSRGIREMLSAVSVNVYRQTNQRQTPTFQEELGMTNFPLVVSSFVKPLPRRLPPPVSTRGLPIPPFPMQFIVLFGFESAELMPEAQAVVAEAGAHFNQAQFNSIYVHGHSDTFGSEKYAVAVSERRAYAVKDYLIANGVPAGRIVARGHGSQELMVQTGDGVRQPENQRAMIDLSWA